MSGAYSSIPPTCLHGVHSNNFSQTSAPLSLLDTSSIFCTKHITKSHYSNLPLRFQLDLTLVGRYAVLVGSKFFLDCLALKDGTNR